MNIKEHAYNKILAKRIVTNRKLNEARLRFKKLSSQSNLDDDELEIAERSISFYGKELQIYDYLETLIQNDRSGNK
jgi:hypothetical protein